MDEYMQYELDCKENEKRNQKFLELFEEWLLNKGLTKKTIYKHYNNVEFFLNDFMVYYGVHKMEDGPYYVGEFLGDWFIRKAMWSTPTSIKENCSSFKKFYQCMLDNDLISKEDYTYLCDEIKNEKETWIQRCSRYNNIDMYEDWF